jgi:hypothetical protein
LHKYFDNPEQWKPLEGDALQTAYRLMVAAFTRCLLPVRLVDIPEFNDFINFISRGSFPRPGRTKLGSLIDEAYVAKRNAVSKPILLFACARVIRS